MLSHALAVLLTLASPGEPFTELGYEAALVRANEQGKLLLVDFTASWCQPCKRMEAETWPHEDVLAWLGEHAIAIQVDVDQQSDLAARFEIQAMPTVVAMRAGEEFDRVVGYRDAAGLLAWGKDVLAGRRSSDALMERAKTLAESEDVQARFELARDLLRAKQYELALTHYLWLWPATRTVPAMGGVRLSFMLSNMGDLAKKHAPAKTAFLGLLDGLQAKVDAARVPDGTDWSEWSALARTFGQSQRVIRWYETRRDEGGRLYADGEGALDGSRPDESRPSASKLREQRIVADVFEALMAADRAQDAVRLYPDARAHAQTLARQYEQMLSAGAMVDEAAGKELTEHAGRKLTGELSELYAALLAAARGAEAADVGALLVRTLDTPESRLALVRAGVAVARQPEADFTRWLDEAEKAGASVKSLRRRLEKLGAASAVPAASDDE